jgi:hypothetical protein
MPKPLPNDLVDEDGDASDWIELHNVSTNDTALGVSSSSAFVNTCEARPFSYPESLIALDM